MHDDLKHFHKNQPKNFVKNPKILKNPKFSTKPKKLGQNHEMHDEWMKKRHTRSRKCTQWPKNTWVGGLECEREVLGGEEIKTIKRDQGEMKKHCIDPLYRNFINLNRPRGVKRYRGLKSVKKLPKSCPESVERCPQLKDLKGSRSLSSSYRASRKFLDGSK